MCMYKKNTKKNTHIHSPPYLFKKNGQKMSFARIESQKNSRRPFF